MTPTTDPTGAFVTGDRLARLLRIEAALERIGSAKPSVSAPSTPQERACPICAALIEEARATLGLAPWPITTPPPTARLPFRSVAQLHRPKGTHP